MSTLKESRTMVVFSLTLVRHGETVANRKNIIQGHQDTDLSDRGEQQARLVGGRLQDEKFTHVFTSDLTRAAKTAQLILETNQASRCKMVYDSRLRERKFGSIEGKTYKDLLAAAQKINTAPADFHPKGSENISQVRERAVRFFEDLCLELRSYSMTEDGDYVPGSIKRRLGSQSLQTVGELLAHQPSARPYPSLSSVPMNKVVGPCGIVEDDVDCAKSKRPRHGSGSGKMDGSGSERLFHIELSQSFQSGQEIVEQSSDVANEQLVTPLSVIARSNSSSSSGYASLPEGTECQDCESDFLSPASNHSNREQERKESRESTPCDIDSLFHPAVSESEIKSSVSAKSGHDVGSRYGCPNVSLSPLLEHRLSSISSISSGRNSSFDDGDGLTVSVADILLVSHGGFLKELIRHFIEDLGCKVPGGKGHALRVSPNTGLSRFMITVEENDRPVITCHQIHDKDHLFNMELPPPGGAL